MLLQMNIIVMLLIYIMWTYFHCYVNIITLLWFGNIFFLNRTLDCYKDKLSITTMIFTRSEDNLALLQLFVFLGISEHMLWIQSMLRGTFGNRELTNGCNYLGYTIIM